MTAVCSRQHLHLIILLTRTTQLSHSSFNPSAAIAFQSRSNFITGFYKIRVFLAALSNADRDGRVLLSAERGNRDENWNVHLKYQLLNPAENFRDITTEARAVILAGGTMAPVSTALLCSLYLDQQLISIN